MDKMTNSEELILSKLFHLPFDKNQGLEIEIQGNLWKGTMSVKLKQLYKAFTQNLLMLCQHLTLEKDGQLQKIVNQFKNKMMIRKYFSLGQLQELQETGNYYSEQQAAIQIYSSIKYMHNSMNFYCPEHKDEALTCVSSASDQFYDLQKSQLIYDQLVEENIRLKHLMNNKNAYQDKQLEDSRKVYPNKKTDVVLNELMKRNRYLEDKVQLLDEAQYRQTSMIRKIESSQKWVDRLRCHPEKCCQQKYLRLLRVRSPLFDP